LPDQQWYKPIDMKFGPDGSLYVLQYGANYFEHNPDSRLVKITYAEGNRQPVARLQASATVGAAPLTVTLSAAESFDYDKNDKLNYTFNFGQGKGTSGQVAQTTVTYTEPGIYKPTVTVTDSEGKKTTAELEIKVGNAPPVVNVDLENANKTFYHDNQKLNYKVTVTDKEDGTLDKGIDPAAVFVSFDYLKQGKDLALLASNTQMTGGVKFLRGKTLIANSDCKSCHNLEAKSIGPSYVAVAERYKGKNAQDMLVEKILKGGNGNWGKNMMAAHPQHNPGEAGEMVKYILSLSDKQNIALPLQGTLTASEHVSTNTAGTYIIRASYTDKGHPVIGALPGSKLISLRSPKVQAEDFDLSKNVGNRHIDGTDVFFVADLSDGSYLGFKNIDLTGINKIGFQLAGSAPGSRIEVRLNTPDGKLIGTAQVPNTPNRNEWYLVTADLAKTAGQQDIYFVFRNATAKRNLFNLDWIYFDNGKQSLPKS
jgi:cytochrome c